MSHFVELCARTNFSFLQGGSHPEEMVEEALRLGYDGIGICDLNGLYGVARGFQTIRSPSFFSASPQGKLHFRYHVGCELTVLKKEVASLLSAKALALSRKEELPVTHLYLLPINKKGYENLCRLLTLGKRQATKGFSQLALSQIADHSEHLMAFCQSDDFMDVHAIFEDRTHIPVCRDLTWSSILECQKAFHLEKTLQASLFATQKPFLHRPERKPVFDVLTCILHHKKIEEAHSTLLQNQERHLKNLDELHFVWRDRPDLLEKTWELSQQLNFDLTEIRYRYPQSDLPAGTTTQEWLRQKSHMGLQKRYPAGPPLKVIQTMEHELKIISQLEYEDYFLTLDEICEFARQKNILHQGRGSAANSVVCYALGLTAVDPTRIDLLFERFISVERGEPPDIDIDFEHQRREEVIQHIYEKYDENHAAMVCTVVRFKSRLAIREVCKVFGVNLKIVNSIVRFMGRDGFRRLVEDKEVHQRFGIEKQKWFLILAIAQELHGFPRHLGIHTGGFLITQDEITQLIPVEKATMSGRFVIQWNKDDVNFLKLMKIDVLSLGMLTALRRCFDLLREHKNMSFSLANIPPDDAATYAMIGKADTVGVFQIESRAQMNTLPRLKPKNFYDLVVEVALVRPGPLQGGMVHPYLRRRQGLEKVVYPHPCLEETLKKTLGVPIFQEQVMKIAVQAAGFSPGEADELRRIMSAAWRRKGTMQGVRQRVLSGLMANGVTEQMAEQIYKTIEGFGNYGFPESHAASFALLSYASSYLKCHHPDVFACALLNSQPMGFYPPRVLIAEAQRNGVQVQPLCLQKSKYDYTLEKGSGPFCDLRQGFLSVAGIPKSDIEKILRKRDQLDGFTDFEDFIRACPFLKKSQLLRLAAAGAFQHLPISKQKDPIFLEVRELLWKIESLSLDSQSFLWGRSKESADESPTNLPFESNWEQMQREYKSTGYSIEHHPLSILRTLLDQKNEALKKQKRVPFFSSQDLSSLRDASRVRLAGLIGIHQRPPTAKGMCFITLEDEFGFMNIVIPPDVYQKNRMVIYESDLIEVHGRLEKRGALLNIIAEQLLQIRPC